MNKIKLTQRKPRVCEACKKKDEKFEEIKTIISDLVCSPIEEKNTNNKMEKSHEQKTVEFYAHDYRDMAMKEGDLMDMLEGFAQSLVCGHQCSSDCRKRGCCCACGEFHF